MTSVIGLLIIAASMRNNYLLTLIGVPFEQLLLWHKTFGIVLIVSLTIHASITGWRPTGIVLASLVAASLASYALLARMSFNLFYYSHVLIYLLIIVFAVLHNAPILAYSGIIWGAELTLRFGLMNRKHVCKAEVVDGFVILTTPKSFAYHAGQYCFLMVPAVNSIEFHPFSISSAPSEDDITFCIKSCGDWTAKLVQAVGGVREDLVVYVDGPYGDGLVDFHDRNTYKVTHFRSWLVLSEIRCRACC